MSITLIFLLFFLLVCANLAWISRRHALGLSVRVKGAFAYVLELLGGFVVFVLVGLWAEQRTMGVRAYQDWEFYVVILLLYAVASMIGGGSRYFYQRFFAGATR